MSLARLLFTRLFGLSEDESTGAKSPLTGFLAAWADFEAFYDSGLVEFEGGTAKLAGVLAVIPGFFSRDTIELQSRLRSLRDRVVHGDPDALHALKPLDIDDVRTLHEGVRATFETWQQTHRQSFRRSP